MAPALAVTMVVSLAGCSAAEEGPSVVATPKISWSPAASVPLETNRYVEAARAADLGYTVAHNAADFTIEQLTATHTGDEVYKIATGFDATYVSGSSDPQVFPGPAIRLPLEVVENSAGDGATITYCEVRDNWLLSADSSDTRLDLSAGTMLTVDIVTKESTGELVEAREVASSDACDATGAAVGRFDPVPDVPEALDENDVRFPADYSTGD
ncbi:MAG: hypothetical protein JWQ43_601 [Glaciihabitans sp.]|nr:hypothetical protein [Glaciihabitans sp.]